MQYDATGNMTLRTDPKNQSTQFTYDDINRVLTEDYLGAGGTEISFGYDWCTNGVGLLCAATTTDVVSRYEYDTLGNISKETREIGSDTFETSFTFDRQSNQTSITNPDGSSVAYLFGSAGRLDAVTFDDVATSTAVIVQGITYAPNGQVSSQTFGNGVVSTHTFDPDELYRLKRISTTND